MCYLYACSERVKFYAKLKDWHTARAYSELEYNQDAWARTARLNVFGNVFLRKSQKTNVRIFCIPLVTLHLKNAHVCMRQSQL